MFNMFSFHVLYLPSCKHNARKPCILHCRCFEGLGKQFGSRSLAKKGDWLNEITWEAIFLATTLRCLLACFVCLFVLKWYLLGVE